MCDAPPAKHVPQACPHLQVTGGHSGCHRPRGWLVSERDRRPPVRERTQQGRANPTRATPKRQSWRGLLQGATGPGSPSQVDPARALQKGGSTLFPRTHRGNGKNPQRDPEVGIRPARGVPRAGRTVRASSKPRARRPVGRTKDTFPD